MLLHPPTFPPPRCRPFSTLLLLTAAASMTCVWFSSVQLTARARLYARYYASLGSADGLGVDPSQRRRLILFWTPFFEAADYGFGLGRRPFLEAGCPVTNCETTTNRSRLVEADAVVFHPRDIRRGASGSGSISARRQRRMVPSLDANVFDVPHVKLSNQRWIFFLQESPLNTDVDLKIFRNLFNWTMTYRKDSDFPVRYGRTRRRRRTPSEDASGEDGWWRSWWRGGDEEDPAVSPPRPPLVDYARNKTRLVAWFVSNCETDSRREDYVRELRDHVPVDIFGACGEFDCPRSREPDCLRLLSDHYKFYLSFENSLCRDYVTEKFWRVLARTTAVPIVMGGADYAADAPPDSFVDVHNFSSPRRLASFLQLLDTHDHLYNEFHAWRRDFEAVEETVDDGFCRLCAALNRGSGGGGGGSGEDDDEAPAPKWYENIDEFWSKDKDCVVKTG